MPSRWMQPVARWNGVLSQYVCVWSQVKTISPPKIDEPIELLFGGHTCTQNENDQYLMFRTHLQTTANDEMRFGCRNVSIIM